MKDKKAGMNSTILQNPADPDATYRKKAGSENRGYIANGVELGGTDGSIVEMKIQNLQKKRTFN